MPGTNIYFSNNGGFSFELLNSDRLVRDWGKQIESRVEVVRFASVL